MPTSHIQRGNNHATVFFDAEDRKIYLNLRLKYTRKYPSLFDPTV